MTKCMLFCCALLLAAPALAQDEGWCFPRTQENPRYPFGLIVSFTMELNERKNAGQITAQDFDWAYGEIGKANQAFGNNEPKAGCLLLEEIEAEFQLMPR